MERKKKIKMVKQNFRMCVLKKIKIFKIKKSKKRKVFKNLKLYEMF